MDPLSLCASILAIITTAQSGVQGLRKLKQCWKAPQEIDDLVIEIESLQSTLRDVAAFVDAAKSILYSESLSQPVTRASSIIDTIVTLFSSPPFRITHLSNANHARLVWLRHKNEIKSLFENLKIVRTDLLLRLGLIAASSVARIEGSLNISMGIQDRLSQQLSIVIDREVNNNGIFQRPMLENSRDLSNDSPRFSVIEPSTRDRVDALDSSTLQSHEVISNSRMELSRRSDELRTEKCAPWCSCRCHVRRSFRSPWVLEMAIGRIAVQYTGQRPDCNEKKCRRTSTAPLALTYFLPQYLLRRYITLTMHYTPLDGPKLALRAPRVTSWSHLYWLYANKGDLPAIQKMFAQRKASPFDLNPRGSNALMYTVNLKDYRISHFLIEQGADPNVPNATGRVASELLFDSSFAGRFGDEGISIVGSMFEDIDSTETRGFTTLHKIVLGIIRNDLRAELENSTASIDVGDSRNRTPLAWAVIRDDLGALETLLAFGADPNIVDDSDDSPLGFVKSSGVCRALLEAGVDIHSRNADYQRTPLHQLCHGHGTVEVVDLLVKAGINVDVLDADHETPLLNAVFWHLTATAERLIELGADVNAANLSSRDNTIHFAVNYGHYQIIPLLLAHDVDYAAINVRGRNIAHMAAISADTNTIDTLAESKLIDLDLLLKDVDGKTPADHLAERETFGESEIGLHEAFEAFVKSVSLPSD